ncbi:MAG: hypothetical protein ACR2OO_08330 [Thermomicrobiales bacterium]
MGCDGDGLPDTQRRPDNIDTTSTEKYLQTQLAAIDRMWSTRFATRGLDYSNPRLVVAKEPIAVQLALDPDVYTKYASNSVACETQATCMAGIWFNAPDAKGTPSDINQAMTYLGTATDQIHGASDVQIKALLKGYHDPNACDL